ncbi:MAG: MATE family efflux transporter [Lachnospiraceae bacterium]|nr:MATE family efflux transporter [Lachnospiraceae bacterium]
MLHGPLFKKILLFALPLAATSLLQQLFNTADQAIVGRFAGSAALAAVGSNGSLITLLINLFVGVSIGSNVLIARMIGEGRRKGIPDAVHTAMTLAIVCGFLLLVIGNVFAKPILILMGAPSDVIDLAALYLRIYFLGMPFFMIYNFGSSILRSVGDTRRPLYCLMFSGVVNVALNLLFVIVFQMSVAGVALATLISNGISACMVLYFLTHEESDIRLSLRNLHIDRECMNQILRIGIPTGLQGVVFSISNIVIQSGINSFGSSVMAGFSAAVSFDIFSFFMINAFSQTSVTFTSQNFGAGEIERCKKVYRLCLGLGLLGSAILVAVIMLGRNFFVELYTTDALVMSYAIYRMMRAFSVHYISGIFEITGSTLRGMGYSVLPTVITLLGSCVFRLIWMFTIFQAHHTYAMLVYIYPISWVVTSIAMLIVYFIIRKRVFARMQTRSENNAISKE